MFFAGFSGGIDRALTIVAMPAYNEERSIAKMVLGCRKHVDYVVVVDDGNSDRTADVAALAGAEVVRHLQNRGKGAALKTGFKALDGAEIPTNSTTEAQRHRERSERYCFIATKGVWGRWT